MPFDWIPFALLALVVQAGFDVAERRIGGGRFAASR